MSDEISFPAMLVNGGMKDFARGHVKITNQTLSAVSHLLKLTNARLCLVVLGHLRVVVAALESPSEASMDTTRSPC